MHAHWVRFDDGGTPRFGTVEGERIRVCEGDMLAGAVPTERHVALAEAALLSPVQPSKVIALWNNFHALAAKLGLPEPAEPLYLLKSPNSWSGPNATIRAP